MKTLRRIIRRLILEQGMTDEERAAEFAKYHNRERADAAIQELTTIFEDAYSFEVGSWNASYNIYEMKFLPEADCVVRIRIYSMWGQLNLDEIETTPQCEGKGYARYAIKMIQDVAKKHQIMIELEAKAFNAHKGEGRMSSAELEKWYASQGFKRNGFGKTHPKMEWKP